MPRRRKLGVDCGSEWTKGYAEKIKVGKPYRQRGNRTSWELKILGKYFLGIYTGMGNQQGWSDWRNLQACKFEAPAVLVVSSFMCFLQGNLFFKKSKEVWCWQQQLYLDHFFFFFERSGKPALINNNNKKKATSDYMREQRSPPQPRLCGVCFT